VRLPLLKAGVAERSGATEGLSSGSRLDADRGQCVAPIRTPAPYRGPSATRWIRVKNTHAGGSLGRVKCPRNLKESLQRRRPSLAKSQDHSCNRHLPSLSLGAPSSSSVRSERRSSVSACRSTRPSRAEAVKDGRQATASVSLMAASTIPRL